MPLLESRRQYKRLAKPPRWSCWTILRTAGLYESLRMLPGSILGHAVKSVDQHSWGHFSFLDILRYPTLHLICDQQSIVNLQCAVCNLLVCILVQNASNSSVTQSYPEGLILTA